MTNILPIWQKTSSQDHYFGYKSADKSPLRAKESTMTNSNNNKDGDSKHSESSNFVSDYCTKDSGHCTNDYKWSRELSEKEPLISDFLGDKINGSINSLVQKNLDRTTIQRKILIHHQPLLTHHTKKYRSVYL